MLANMNIFHKHQIKCQGTTFSSIILQSSIVYVHLLQFLHIKQLESGQIFFFSYLVLNKLRESANLQKSDFEILMQFCSPFCLLVLSQYNYIV